MFEFSLTYQRCCCCYCVFTQDNNRTERDKVAIMDPNCSNSNAYVATSLVNNFHAIPHVDIDLNDISSDFRLDINYFEVSRLGWYMKPRDLF